MAQHKLIIIGAGLAGLALSIELAKAGLDVAVIDKLTFPAHKVCGEYLSKESIPYLKRLGVNINDLSIADIAQLKINTNDQYLEVAELPLGAIGISRYLLDKLLYELALAAGVIFYLDTKVIAVDKSGASFIVDTNKGNLQSERLIAASGKLSIRGLFNFKPTKENYLGVKYHLKNNTSRKLIQLFTFPNGYAGMSAVENDLICFAYLIKAEEYKKYKSIEAFEQSFAQSNNNLYKILNSSIKHWSEPLIISNIYFGKKATYDEAGIIYLGDAAGAIPPLAGNGMSMALRSAAFLSNLIINQETNKQLTWEACLKIYDQFWNKTFNKRIKIGLIIQRLMINPKLAKYAITVLKKLKFLQKKLIRSTHGEPF